MAIRGLTMKTYTEKARFMIPEVYREGFLDFLRHITGEPLGDENPVAVVRRDFLPDYEVEIHRSNNGELIQNEIVIINRVSH
jgi:hypothetical protein